VTPVEFLDEFLNPKTRVLGLSDGEDFVILVRVVFTDRQTDRQTDGRTAPDDSYYRACSYADAL